MAQLRQRCAQTQAELSKLQVAAEDFKARYLAERAQRRTLHEHLQACIFAAAAQVPNNMAQSTMTHAQAESSCMLKDSVSSVCNVCLTSAKLSTTTVRQVLRGNIRVICRLRPPANDEEPALWTQPDAPGQLTLVDAERKRQRKFEFNEVCPCTTSQEEVFQVRVSVQSCKARVANVAQLTAQEAVVFVINEDVRAAHGCFMLLKAPHLVLLCSW
jgi:aldehyde:ferredoxin oxidoreductase